MKDYLITVESTNGMNPEPVHSIRTIDKSEDFAEGIVVGLKAAYPKNEVYKMEIKN